MQLLGGLSTGGTVYTDAQVAAVLTGAVGQHQWLIERLDRNGTPLADISAYVDLSAGARVTHDASAMQKRVLTMRIRADCGIVVLQDMIRVSYRLRMADGGWRGWSLGTFVALPPIRRISDSVTWWEFTCPDISEFLAESKFIAASAVSGNVYAAVQALVASYGGAFPIKLSMTDPAKAIPTTLGGWEAGVSRLQAIDDILTAVNYIGAWVDETMALRTSAVPDYTQAPPSFTFDTTQGASIVNPDLADTPDWGRAVNRVRVDCEDLRRQPITQTYQNDNPLSIVSVPRLGYTITRVIKDSTIVDAPTALARAKSECQAGARIFSVLRLVTFPWPVSQNLDLYALTMKTADEALATVPYLETKWEHVVGGQTTHEFERVVPS